MLNLKTTSVLSSILLFLLMTILVYSFFSDFGLRDDEGFYLYYLKYGIDEPTFTFFHTIGNIFGPLFSYQLYGFRLLNLLLLLISINISSIAAYQFYNSSNKIRDPKLYLLLIVVSITTLGFFSFIPTFSYTSSSTIACFFWSAGLFYIAREHKKSDIYFNFILVLTFLFAIGSRIQMFVVLIATLPIFLYFINNLIKKTTKVSILKSLLVVTVFSGLFVFFHRHFLIEIYPVGKIIYETSHDSLIIFYIQNIKYLLSHQDFYVVYLSFGLITIYLFLKLKLKKDLRLSILVSLILFLVFKDIYGFTKSYFDIEGTPSNFSNRALRYLYVLTVFSPILIEYFSFLSSKFKNIRYEADFKLTFIFIVTLLGTIFSSVGNGSNLIFWASFSIGLTSIPFFLKLISLSEGVSFKYLVIVVAIIFATNLSIVYRDQVYQFRRSPIKSSSFKTSNSIYLSKIKIDSDSSNTIDNLLLTLEKVKFNSVTDRIFAYPELPGLIASVDAKSLGDPHSQHSFSNKKFRELKSIQTKICTFLEYENLTGIKEVYILEGESIPTLVEDCLFRIIDKESRVEVYEIGELENIGMAYNDYVNYRTQIKLIGPYRIKSK